MGNKVMITCDSTCDLSSELTDQYGIKVNPLSIVMDGVNFLDDVTVKPEDIFTFYETTGRLATTTAVNVAEYQEFFKPIVDNGYSIVHFCISSSMSSSYNNGRLAAADFQNVYFIDSKSLSTGSGIQVLKACELRDKGLSASEIADEINSLSCKVDASFVVDTLTFLYKGGRCSGLAALGANLLKLKPCIEVKNGVNAVGKKYRGKQADVLCEYVSDRLHNASDIETDRVFITHTCSDEIVGIVENKIKELVVFKEVIITKAGCSVSVHCGRNTLGIMFYRKTAI